MGKKKPSLGQCGYTSVNDQAYKVCKLQDCSRTHGSYGKIRSLTADSQSETESGGLAKCSGQDEREEKTFVERRSSVNNLKAHIVTNDQLCKAGGIIASLLLGQEYQHVLVDVPAAWSIVTVEWEVRNILPELLTARMELKKAKCYWHK
ncbi:hypothetical protein AVEN_221575-1 [Araneus ventricosus]|uniref:Uncharacterized protein n=1 Tax=Araneus ventricosus TaxID=182803 RepID=A0A4Y2F9X8_ARAVE|nr:hypothetical protein AVEN_221575-1 [Araneus ventricosus]